ncbi:MAG: sodium:alanine symporter family protein [Coriobacteriia bacterium]|nr:sodium:alanine symporter family protein [Coriobacteriia bacterium]MBS5477156.1 sodium:alanine symporter family protein [Coriobacteriia bacterium]
MDVASLADAAVAALKAVDAWIWGIPMIVVLLGSHIFLTVRTGFIQRKIPAAIKMTFAKDAGSSGDISQFGALCSALSSTIGTGNIVGVGTAVFAGGPGAVLWMWLTGVFGIATKYAETFVAVRYRVKDHKGEMLGGAMYAWERGFLKHKDGSNRRPDGKAPVWARMGAVLFALLAAIASFGIGSAVQSTSLADVITTNAPGVPAWAVGLGVVVLVSLVIFGGVKWLAKVCERIVPFMAIVYVLCCIAILVINGPYVWSALQLIVECAFTPKAAFGGAVGSGIAVALQFGCARGLFSNESGMGSAPIVASAAVTTNPARQALVSMTGTFWDTVVVCLLTGLVLVSTLVGNPEILADGTITAGAQLTSAAFAKIPVIGTPALVFGMVLFAFTTIIGWSYYGNRCVTYLFGKRAILPYQIIYVAIAFLGAVGLGDVAWTCSDIANALMVVPNIICVLLLSGLVARETRHYVWDGHIEEQFDEEIPVHEDK